MRCVLIALFVACSAEAATYRGIERSDAWVDRAYLHFRTRVASVEAKWVDVSWPTRYATTLPPLTVARVYCRVLRALPEGLLVTVATYDRSIVRATSKKRPPTRQPDRFTNGQRLLLVGVELPEQGSVLTATVVAIGTASVGTTKVYRCVEVPSRFDPLTREQFVALLASGFRLYEWRDARKAVGNGSIPDIRKRYVP